MRLWSGFPAVAVALVVSAAIATIMTRMTDASITSARTIAYISNADSREIYVLELEETDGGLKLVEKIAVSGSIMPLAVSPDRRFLFGSLRSEPYAVSTFAIDAGSGRLKLQATTPLADNMCYLSTDRTGRYLFSASYSGHKISVNVIGPNAEISARPQAVIPTGRNAHAVATDLSNRFLFVTNLGDDAILQYRFDQSSGAITPNEPPLVKTARGAGPRHFVFHPNRRFVFCLNELDGTVSTYGLSGSGTLTGLDSISMVPSGFKEKPAAADIHLTSDASFLYASERASSTLAAFRVNPESGKLTLIGNYPTETQPRGFNIDPHGKYLLAAGQKSNRLSTYAIDQKTGTLRLLSQLEMGGNPNWIEIVELPR